MVAVDALTGLHGSNAGPLNGTRQEVGGSPSWVTAEGLPHPLPSVALVRDGTDANGGQWLSTYDDQGRVIQRVDPLGSTNRLTYTGRRLTAIVDPLGHTTQLDYDAQHNLTAVTTPDRAVRFWDYDFLGRVIARTDPNGNVQRRTYDMFDRPIRIDEPDGNSRRLAYDGEGNLVRVADVHRDTWELIAFMRDILQTAGGAARVGGDAS